MATKAWFDYATYMAHKLTQMQETYPNEKWTAASLQKAFDNAGYVGDEGAQRHFQKWGHTEDVSPNKFFDANYYYQAKAIQYYGLPENGGLTKAQVEADMDTYAKNMEGAIKAAGMDAWTHYIKWGTAEGINPSNEFDTSDYMAAKLAALQAAEPSAGWTMASMNAAFKSAGLNALEHCMQYGGKGAGEVASANPTIYPVPAAEQIEDNKTDGTTTDFTTGTDNITGTNGNDAFNGVWGGATNESTYQVGDTLNDPSTTDADVLNLRLNSEDTSPFVAVKNVETVNLITSATDQDAKFDASGFTGTKKMMVNQQQGSDTTINGITSLDTAVGVNGKGGLIANFNSTLLTGSSDTVKVALEGAGSANTDAGRANVDVSNNNAVEVVAIESTGTNYVDLTGGAKAATYTVKGDGENHITLLSGEPKEVTFEASTTTKGQSVTFTGKQSVTANGGAGDDRFIMADTLDSKDQLDGGSGSDTMVANISGKITPAKIENVETFNLTVDKAATLVGTNVKGLNKVVLDQKADATFNEMAKDVADLVLNTSSNNAAVKFNYVKDAAGELTITAGQNDTGKGIDGSENKGTDQTWGGLTLNNASKVVVNSFYDPHNTEAVTNNLGALSLGNAKSLSLNTTGSGDAVADLTAGAITAASLTDLTLNTTEKATLTVGAFADADALKTFSVDVASKGGVTYGAIGADEDTLNTIAIKVGENGTLNGGEITAGDKVTSLSVELGDYAKFVDAEGDAIALGNIDAGASKLTTFDVKVGKLDGNMGLGTITVDSINGGSIEVGEQTTAGRTLTVAVKADTKVDGLTISTGKNAVVNLTVDDINVHDSEVGTVTLSGTGTVSLTNNVTLVSKIDDINATDFKGTFDLSNVGALAEGVGITITSNGVKGILSEAQDTVTVDEAEGTISKFELSEFTGGDGGDVLNMIGFGVSGFGEFAEGALDNTAYFVADDSATVTAATVIDKMGECTLDSGNAVILAGDNTAGKTLNVYLVEGQGEDTTLDAENLTLLGTVEITAAVDENNFA